MPGVGGGWGGVGHKGEARIFPSSVLPVLSVSCRGSVSSMVPDHPDVLAPGGGSGSSPRGGGGFLDLLISGLSPLP